MHDKQFTEIIIQKVIFNSLWWKMVFHLKTVEKPVKSVEKCGITNCITDHTSKSGVKRKVFPSFHRVFHRNKRRCNIQQLSTALFDLQKCELHFVIILIFGVLKMKLFTKNAPDFY